MPKSRRMNAGMQKYQIGKMLAGTPWDSEKFDIHAHMDRTLHLDENLKNIRSHLGITTRDRGSEMYHQRIAEQARERKRRSDPLFMTGISNQVIDMRFQAMRPGKRYSHTTQHRYYERRENRADRGRLL
jgi:hypothetical protein